MRRLNLVALTIFFLSNTLFASWAYIPLDKLVTDSDLIVVGTLQSAVEDSQGLGKGYVLVDQIITKGPKTSDGTPLKPGDNLKITWEDNWACAAGMHLRWENQKAIWLLKVKSDGTVAAGYPGRFRPLEDLSKIESLLRNVKNIDVSRVDVSIPQPESVSSAEPFDSSASMKAVDVSPYSDYSAPRAILTVIFSLGLYWILYKSRFRIR